MENFESELKTTFLDEAADLVAEADHCFLELEKDPARKELLEKTLRIAHNLKGSASAVGFQSLADFVHKLEWLLLKIKNGEIPSAPMVMDLLFACGDWLGATIRALKADLGAAIDGSALMAQMHELEGLAGAPSRGAALADAGGKPELASREGSGCRPPDGKSGSDLGDIALMVQQSIEAIRKVSPEEEPQTRLSAAAIQAVEAPSVPASAREKTVGDDTIRVGIRRIDDLLNNVGELVILQTVLFQHRHLLENALLKTAIGQMSKIIREVQELSMGLRLVSFRQVFNKLQRIVRDTSHALGKEATLELVGDETEVDKTVLDHLSDPLVHLIRNAVDHGLESGDERESAGKPRAGRIRIEAGHRGSKIVVSVRDDGRGMSAARLVETARRKGLIGAETLEEQQALQLIFLPGFTTKATATDISGRGVGLDVVMTNLRRLNGDIEISTREGEGTEFRIYLPLTLAIVDGLVVTLGAERYVVPVAQVAENIKISDELVTRVAGRDEILDVRGESLPLFRLGRLLRKEDRIRCLSEQPIALVVRDSRLKPFAVLVDEVQRQQQVVIKRLGEELRGIAGISGAAILGDGRASLILDLPELVKAARGRFALAEAVA